MQESAAIAVAAPAERTSAADRLRSVWRNIYPFLVVAAIWEAIAWAAVSGRFVGIARMLASRKAADYYTKSTGHLPPDLVKDDQDADNAAPTTT